MSKSVKQKMLTKEVDLRKRALFAIEFLILITMLIFLFYPAIRTDILLEIMLLFPICLLLLIIYLWLLALAITGLLNRSLFLMLGMKERPTHKLF